MKKKTKKGVISCKYSMPTQIIKKAISIIIVSSLILCNVCTNKVISASRTATGMILGTSGMTATATYKASEKFIQGKDISFVDATTDIANIGYAGYIIGNVVSIGATILNEYTGIVDKGIEYFDNLDKTQNSNLSIDMNIANSNSTIQGCEKAKVDYSEGNNSLKFNYQKETKAGFQVKSSEVVEYWNEYLGNNQTNVNPYNGVVDKDRIFSEDGLRSIRFGAHEMNKIETTKFHFHQENLNYNSTTGKTDISNTLIRIK